MESYIAQLLEELKAAAAQRPDRYPYEIDHPMPEGKEWIPELALSPFKAVAEWTGIVIEAFPPAERLNSEQINQVVPLMEALWEAYGFSFDIAEEMASKDASLRYRMMVDCWDDQVQYLPQSGFDIELCAGDSSECRMGIDCLCLYDPPEMDGDEGFGVEKNGDPNEELPF